MNVSEIVNAACRQLGFEPDAAGLADGMEALNLLLQEWATGPLGLYKVTRENFSTVAATASYAIGTGQTFNTARPIRVVRAFTRTSNADYQIDVYESAEDYADKGYKALPGRPNSLYYERSYPYGAILLYPVPDAVYDLHLYSHKALGAYTTTSDDLALPPEYEPALKFNLAVDLSEEFGKPLSQTTAARAQQTLDALKRLHAHPVPRSVTDPFNRSASFDMTSGGYIQ